MPADVWTTMLIRLALAFVLAVTGAGVSGLVADQPSQRPAEGPAAVAVPTGPVVLPRSGEEQPAADAGEAGADADPGTDGVTVQEIDVVVPPVAPTGDVVDSPATLEAQAAPDVVVTDTVVEAGRVESGVIEAGDFQMVGVTWPDGAEVGDLGAQVRARTDGQWSDWATLEQSDTAPDAGTADATHAVRAGTDPLWVGDADAVQLSFTGTEAGGPDGMSLALVDVPPVPEVDAAGALFTGEATVTTAAFGSSGLVTASAPQIITRGQWGARDQVCAPDVASKLVGAVVHHTAGSNSYASVADAKRQIQGDQRYHIESRGWCDIGYNFIVDKWGNIYEGRANSLTKAVIGVHAGGFNTGTVGVSMLGSYDAVPSAATQRSVAQIIGWRLGAYGLNPEGSMTYYTGSGENSKFKNQNVALPRVFGHRDVAYTACPGNGGYAALGTIRSMAASFSYDERFRQANAVVKAMYADLLGRGVDPSGLQTWSGLLASGAGGPALVAALTNSDEYIRLRIRQAYEQVLGRSAEPAGMENWHRQIRAGVATVDDVRRRFLSSGEFMQKSGGTVEGYITRMYTSVLGRAPWPSDVDHWSTEMRRLGQETVTDQIWFSREAAGIRAAAYYQVFLKRAADGPGRDSWTTVLLTRGEGAVRIGIAGSDEYRERAMLRYP